MIIFLCQFFFSPFWFFTSSKRFSRQLHQVERKLAEIRNMALTVDCFFFYYYYYYYLFAHFLLIHPLKHLLFQLDYRAAANEVEALKEENDLLRRKYVHSRDCRMFPLEIFPWLVALVSSHSPVEQKRHPFAIRHSPLTRRARNWTAPIPFSFTHLSPKIHIQFFQTDLHTFLLRTVERIWFKIKAFSLW